MSLTPLMNSDSPEDRSKVEQETGAHESNRNFRAFGILIAIALLIGAGEAIYAVMLSNRLQKAEHDLQAQITMQDESVRGLRNRLGVTEDQFGDLQGDLTSTKDHLGKAQIELRKTRQASDELAKKQKETADALRGQLATLQEAQASTSGAVGTLSSDVTGVKEDVSVTKKDLASTRSELQRVIGDLGVQSGLVAHNRDELAELRLRGERDYYEFDLRKTKQPQKFAGGVALQLKKADTKKQKYTVDLISDDRRIEKKDKNTNEPVQFYQQGYGIPTEVVVNKIYPDRIVGYISVPKQKQARASSGSEAAASFSGSGS